MSIFSRLKKRKPLPTQNAFNNEAIPVTLEVNIAQSLGITRNRMEDALYTLQINGVNVEKHYTLGLFMVADGMGGHIHGEMASRCAIQAASSSLLSTIVEPVQRGKNALSDEEIKNALENAVNEAQQAVLNQVNGGGTTLTIALVFNKGLHFAHVGDSRLYISSDTHTLQSLTVDHSLVRRLVDLGQISEDDALAHPQRNILFRALGQQEGFKIDIGHYPLTEPCNLLLCTDGLWGLVDSESLSEHINSNTDHKEMVNSLIQLANSAGGTDNISAILVKVS